MRATAFSASGIGLAVARTGAAVVVGAIGSVASGAGGAVVVAVVVVGAIVVAGPTSSISLSNSFASVRWACAVWMPVPHS